MIKFNSGNVSKILAEADLAVLAGGSMLWEAFLLETAVIAIQTAENQSDVLANLAKDGVAPVLLQNSLNRTSFAETLLSACQKLEFIAKSQSGMVDGQCEPGRISNV